MKIKQNLHKSLCKPKSCASIERLINGGLYYVDDFYINVQTNNTKLIQTQ